MGQAIDLESRIVQAISDQGPCSFDELTRRLASYSWSQLFLTVDRLSREGRLRLLHPSRVGFSVSLADRRTEDRAVSLHT